MIDLATLAGAISSSSSRIKAFCQASAKVSVDHETRIAALEAAPAPTPVPAPAPDTPPVYSTGRAVFTLGNPAYQNWMGSPDAGWGFTDANGNGVLSTMGWSRRGGRQLGSTSTSNIDQRVYWDTTVDVMNSIVGYQGDPVAGGRGLAAACQSVACRMVGTDPADNSTGQAFGLELDSFHFGDANLGGVRPGPLPGETHFHGWAMVTSPSFSPQPVDAFNSIGLELHRSIESANSHSSSGMFLLPKGPTADGGTRTDGCLNGASWMLGTEQTVAFTRPRIGFLVNGGDYLKDVEDSTNTSRFIVGPDFLPGRRIRVAHQMCFTPAKADGFVRLWIDNGDGRGYVQYADMAGVATIFQKDGVADGAIYPIMQHYRRTWPAAPDMTVWYAGFVRGQTLADVTV